MHFCYNLDVILSVSQFHTSNRTKEYSREEKEMLIMTSMVRIWSKAMMYTIRFPIGLIMSEDNLWSLLSLEKKTTIFLAKLLVKNLNNDDFLYWNAFFFSAIRSVILLVAFRRFLKAVKLEKIFTSISKSNTFYFIIFIDIEFVVFLILNII